MSTAIPQSELIKSAREEFFKAARNFLAIFNSPKHKKHIGKLSPRFLVAMMDLEVILDTDPPMSSESLLAACRPLYRQFGAPGDFGYGHPSGDSLRALYDRHRDLGQAMNDI